MIRLRAFWEYLRSTYWAVPSAMAATAAALALAMARLDDALTAAHLDRLTWVYGGGPDGARAVLSTIAGSMITVAGVTFSITIVALTLASQQFGPRLLRSFLRDTGNQVVLGTFVSTFLYCLLVLRTIRGTDAQRFVPHLAVTLGVVLAMVSLGVLIFFIHHVATSIQASRIIAKVAADLGATASRLFPDRFDAIGPEPDEDDAAALFASMAKGERRAVRATAAGYVQAVDLDGLVSLARDQDAVLRLHVRPGSFVREGHDVITVSSLSFAADWSGDAFRRAVFVGAERTGTQDVEFFIHQLVEMAVRALSPGINDPATARACLDRLEQALCDLATRRFPRAVRYDQDHMLRLVAAPVGFRALVDSALAEVGRYGASSVSVTSRLLEAIGSVAACVVTDARRRPLSDQATAVVERSRTQPMATADRDRLEQQYQAVLTTLGDAG